MRRLHLFFFFNDTATTEIYTLSLHDALPIWPLEMYREGERLPDDAWRSARPRELLLYLLCHPDGRTREQIGHRRDWKSTRLNSSHANISYAVFCLKKKQSRTNKETIEQSFTT